ASLLSNYKSPLTVITNGLSTGNILKQNDHINVLIIGGLLKKDSNTVYDEFSHSILTHFNIDKYFFSATGLSVQSGFSERNLMEVKHKRENILNAKKAIALIDHTKFNNDSSSTFCSLDEVDCIVTDEEHESQVIELYEKKIQIL